jgi:hypothetical protein
MGGMHGERRMIVCFRYGPMRNRMTSGFLDTNDGKESPEHSQSEGIGDCVDFFSTSSRNNSLFHL